MAAHKLVGDKIVGVVRISVELGGTVRLLQPALALVVGGLEPRPVRLDLVSEVGQLTLLAAGPRALGVVWVSHASDCNSQPQSPGRTCWLLRASCTARLIGSS